MRSSGAPGTPSPAASGTTAGTTANVTGLSGYIKYYLYVRSDCGGGDQSTWMYAASFTTIPGCGSTWISPGGVNTLVDGQFTTTYTICPDNPGDVVTLEFTTWNGLLTTNQQYAAMFIYNGDNTSAPLIAGTGTGYTQGAWIRACRWMDRPSRRSPPPRRPVVASP
ncbi:MAG: hypothetical protein QM724_03060 [Flavobacteriales bacterium]